YVPPDSDEAPPVELWRAVGDVTPWGTALLVVSWAALFAALALRREIEDPQALLAWGASAPGLSARDSAWRLLASPFLHAGAAPGRTQRQRRRLRGDLRSRRRAAGVRVSRAAPARTGTRARAGGRDAVPGRAGIRGRFHRARDRQHRPRRGTGGRRAARDRA